MGIREKIVKSGHRESAGGFSRMQHVTLSMGAQPSRRPGRSAFRISSLLNIPLLNIPLDIPVAFVPYLDVLRK